MAEPTAAEQKIKKADPIALAKNSIYAVLTNEKTIQAIKDALPEMGVTPQRVASIAFSVISRSPQLLACDARSLVRVIIETSLLGLSLDPHLKQAAIVPFANNKGEKKFYEATLIVEYMGLVKLARNSGALRDVDAHVVYELDAFDYEEGLEPKLYHKPARGNRGKPVGVYAVGIMMNGDRKFRFLEEWEVNFYREKSRAKDSADSPWNTDPMSMWRKTAIRRLCGYLPMDDKTQRAIHHDEMLESGQPQVLAPEVFDAVIDVTPEPPKKTKTEEAKEKLKKAQEPSRMPASEAMQVEGGGEPPEEEEEEPPAPISLEDEKARLSQFSMTFHVVSSTPGITNQAQADVLVSEATAGKIQSLPVLKASGTIEQMKAVEEYARNQANAK